MHTRDRGITKTLSVIHALAGGAVPSASQSAASSWTRGIASHPGHRRSVRFRRSGSRRKRRRSRLSAGQRACRATAARTAGTVKSATIPVARATRRSEYHVLSAWTTGPPDPIMGQPVCGLTPDRSRIRPKSRSTRRCHPCSCALVPGLRPVSVKGIQAALRALGPSLDRARPALTEGQGCGLTRTLVSGRVVSPIEFPQWVESRHPHQISARAK
jgi:hypothetical protein